MSDNIQNTLNERNSTHGDFMPQATFAQDLKEQVRDEPRYNDMSYDQKEALDMILTKISRILHGNPNHADSWHDIAGYATLVVNRLEHGTSHLLPTE